MSDTVEYQSNYMLTPKDVLCITATGHRSDFAPEKYITIKNQHISYKKIKFENLVLCLFHKVSVIFCFCLLLKNVNESLKLSCMDIASNIIIKAK